ncbi:hypothetical protein PsorP6_012628 [Peronosclerospora sorghi]|uniref:Uncharacterized protein n=1 Tax=Peronosclerospora sorghi TaxID=230839 RepID=A0ACC0WFY5_9STRA|nr:hypothetical protein PsorP6_012628 [Peronosclerospora sorghi]
MFRTLSSYDDTPVRTVWRDTGVLAKCCVGFTSLVWRPASPRPVAARREQTGPVDDDGGTGPLCPRPSSTFFAHGDARDAGPGRDAPLCRDSLELTPRRRLVPSARPPFAVFVSSRASSSSSLSTLSDQAGPLSVCELAAFIKRILKLARTDAECIIMTLVCVERLLTATRGRLEIQRATWLRMEYEQALQFTENSETLKLYACKMIIRDNGSEYPATKPFIYPAVMSEQFPEVDTTAEDSKSFERQDELTPLGPCVSLADVISDTNLFFVDTASALQDCTDYLLKCPVIGFDSEWKAVHISSGSDDSPAKCALLQLASLQESICRGRDRVV